MAKRKEEAPPPGAPLWLATFGDLMNLLLCFYVLLFSMSTIDAQKFEAVQEAFNREFTPFRKGAMVIGDGILITNGASQLEDLLEYINSSGMDSDAQDPPENVEESQQSQQSQELLEAEQKLDEAKLAESEKMAEQILEALRERMLEKEVDIEFTAQYVQLTLNGALLFDSGSVELKEAAYPVLDQVGAITQRYAQGHIQIEGHTDNRPMSGAKYSNNDELSGGRALSVFEYMIAHTAIDPGTVIHAGRGEYVPVADNGTPEGRSKNRRVEIKIYNSLSSY